jgi:hypothetical protein
VAGAADEVRGKVRSLLQSDIDELTIIPFGKSKESVIKMFAEEGWQGFSWIFSPLDRNKAKTP